MKVLNKVFPLHDKGFFLNLELAAAIAIITLILGLFLISKVSNATRVSNASAFHSVYTSLNASSVEITLMLIIFVIIIAVAAASKRSGGET